MADPFVVAVLVFAALVWMATQVALGVATVRKWYYERKLDQRLEERARRGDLTRHMDISRSAGVGPHNNGKGS